MAGYFIGEFGWRSFIAGCMFSSFRNRNGF
jgi:hypothetical protein